MSHELLIEIGTEELPPTSLKSLSDAFSSGIGQGLKKVNLQFESLSAYATPRRLAVVLQGLSEKTPEEEVKVWGPPAKIAFDADGNPTKAAEAFAKKNGAAIADLKTENDGKVDKLLFVKQAGGETAESLLGDIVRESLANLPIKKRMRWGSSRAEFVRPVHWIVFLLNDRVLEEEFFGIKSSNVSRGHRFHHNEQIEIDKPSNYKDLLRETGHIVVDFAERSAMINEQVQACAKDLKGTAVIDDDLLEEVTALVEWPVALAGRFEEAFLSVPAEALISSMKEHQKYFHVEDANGKLLPHFVTVSNIVSQDPAAVIDGNERVIRPRLADAAFFFETDKKTTLEKQRERLKDIVFQAKLGSIYDKTERIRGLANFVAEQVGSDKELSDRAATLCKSDLVSNMVYEFADMQGIAGYHYALNDGENEEVAKAIDEQYMPRFAGDELPSTSTGALVALADRLDTITGIFGIGQTPTGSKDPFALRRASLGALRILVEKEYDLDLRDLISKAASQFEQLPKADSVVGDVLSYMLERFKAWYEEENISAEVFQSVSAKNLSCPLDINNRVYAVQEFSQLAEAQALAAANKRVSNIIAKFEGSVAEEVDQTLLSEEAEKNLAKEVGDLEEELSSVFAARDYTKGLTRLASLRESVDKFFDDVMVMTDDEKVRDNRLALLNQLRNLFLEVADISYLVTK